MLDNSQAEIKTAKRNISLRYADDTKTDQKQTKTEEELKSLLMV